MSNLQAEFSIFY